MRILACSLVVILCFIAIVAHADDSRISSREIAGLQTLVGQMAANASHFAAMLDVEKLDHAETQKQLIDLQKWVHDYFSKEKR